MKQQQFEQRYQTDWQNFEQQLSSLEQRRHDSGIDSDFPHLYQRLCHHLAVAQQRAYSPALVDHLNQLAVRGYRQLYRDWDVSPTNLTQFFWRQLPLAIARERFWLLLACALFYLPGVLMYGLVMASPHWVFTIFGPEQLAMFEVMYDPTGGLSQEEREAQSDFSMFGYYIWNNISVGFQAFASGLLLGIGTVIALIYNGLILGGLAAHLQNLEQLRPFVTFVLGHGAFELPAIVVCGAAGLRLGAAIVAPGPWCRSVALRLAAQAAAPLLSGAIVLFVFAAVVEAYWSSSALIADPVKWSVAAVLWLLVVAYCVWSCRQR